MALSIAYQIALTYALEATLQVVYDVLKLTPFYKAFQVTADAPEIYMQEFWASAYVHNRSVRFKMNNKKHIIGLEQFRDILQICPKVGNKKFVDPPLETEIIIFLASLGHSGDIRKLSDVNVNKLHQPWRSFAAVINKCLCGTPSYDSLRLSQAQILWGMYNQKTLTIMHIFCGKTSFSRLRPKVRRRAVRWDPESLIMISDDIYLESSDMIKMMKQDQEEDDARHKFMRLPKKKNDDEHDEMRMIKKMMMLYEDDSKMTFEEEAKVNKLRIRTYGDTVTIKRPRDGADDDEEPSAGTDRGSKRRRSGKEPASTSAPSETITKTAGKTTSTGTKTHTKSASQSAPAGDAMHSTDVFKGPADQEFETGVQDEQAEEEVQHLPDWFQKPTRQPSPDHAWNTSVPAVHESVQPWLSNLAQQDPRESFDELTDSTFDFSAFVLNRLKCFKSDT
ncbi:hypothetical protein Tco_0110695 [Tanacetum coccineum]